MQHSGRCRHNRLWGYNSRCKYMCPWKYSAR